MSDRNWVVWSFEHDAWWAANRCGYVAQLLLAGVYTEAEAKEIERRANHPLCINEEARPLAPVLRELREAWGRRGAIVLDVMLSQTEHAPQDQASTVPELSLTQSAPKGALGSADDV